MRKVSPKGKRKTTCSKCDEPLDETRVHKQRYCKLCHAAHMRLTRPKHSELTEEARKKANCRAHTKVYISRGKVIRMACWICGDSNSESHHEDYTNPKDVIWFCRAHHMELHKLKDNNLV